MNLTIRLTIAVLTGIMALTFSSCKHEGEYDHTDLTFIYSCTQDVLEHFTPVVSITNSNGSKREIKLDQNDFRKHTEDNIFQFDNTVNPNIPVYYYPLSEILQGVKGNINLTVEYMPKTDQRENYVDNYCFADAISSYQVKLICQKGHAIEKYNYPIYYNFQSRNPEVTFEQMLHFYDHRTYVFDLTYSVIEIDDDVTFDYKNVISIGTHDNVLTLKNN